MQLRDFLELLGKETGLEASELEILAGFPPAPIHLPSDPGSTVSSLPIANGDTLLVRRREKAASTAQEDLAPDATASNVAEVTQAYAMSAACPALLPVFVVTPHGVQQASSRAMTTLVSRALIAKRCPSNPSAFALF